MYSKTKLNLKVSIKDKFDKNKQVRALMPNLIHSLDTTSLSLLYDKFTTNFNKPQFYSVHDCFGVTMDKVFMLKTLLVSVYTDLYSSDPYLHKFDKYIFDIIDNNTDYTVNRDKRCICISNKPYLIHDID
jgi:DNA-directed RNA polymerase